MSGSIRCWGRNNHGQTDAPGGTNWTAVTGGEAFSCALDEDGKVACWGRNNYGQLNVPAEIASTNVAQRFNLTVQVSPVGAGTVSGGGTYEQNDVAQLSAAPADGWRFVRWEGDTTGTSAGTFISVNANKSVTAVFERIPEPVVPEGGVMTGEAIDGRIVAQRLDDGRIEFGFQPEGEDRILPRSRYFPANARVDRWLVSSDVVFDGEVLGRITARRLDDGRVEFGFIPDGGDRILPSGRYFPSNARTNRWLHSTIIEVDVSAVASIDGTAKRDPPAVTSVSGEQRTLSERQARTGVNDDDSPSRPVLA